MKHGGHPEFSSSHTSAALDTPNEFHAAFDAKAQAWEEYTNTPLGRLRQELTQRYLVQHLPPLPPGLQVLDVGGGTGSYALPLAQLGHQVCLLDFSAHMLSTARDKALQLGSPLIERLNFCHVSVDQIPSLFAANYFDLILCHTFLEYVAQPCQVLQALIRVLRPGGLLSLLFANTYASPLCWALSKGDLEKARLALLGEQVSSADLFGLPRHTFTAEEMQEAMTQVGVEVVATYGVRVFADYVPAEQLTDPHFYARLLELESIAGTLLPYRQIARYNQLLGRKLEM